MKVHHIHHRQRLNMTEQQAWDFFSSPDFLNEITPDFFHVRIDSPIPDSIYAGLLISYRMRAVFGLPMTWVSDISHCDEPHYFVYRQMLGPFRFWSHEVRIDSIDIGVEMQDIVYYAMPFGPLGELFHTLFIGSRLRQIFSHRALCLEQKWGVS